MEAKEKTQMMPIKILSRIKRRPDPLLEKLQMDNRALSSFKRVKQTFSKFITPVGQGTE